MARVVVQSTPKGLVMNYFGLIDMDGVLVDFMRGALARHNRLDVLENYPRGLYHIEQHLGLTIDQVWQPLQGFDFWAELPWSADFFQFVETINEVFGINWAICSTPCDDPYSAAGKLAGRLNTKVRFEEIGRPPRRGAFSTAWPLRAARFAIERITCT